MANATLHEYLDVDSSIRFIRDKLDTKFFLESNLFDLCVSGKIKPIIYHTGELWITPEKEQSYCKDDFNGIDNSNFLDYEHSQLTNFMGYLYLQNIGRDETNFDNIVPRRIVKIQNVIASSPICNINKIGKFNKSYGVYLATIPKNGSHAFIANDFDIKELISLIEQKQQCKNDFDKYMEISEKQSNLIYRFVEIKRSDLRFSTDDLVELLDKDLSVLIKDVNRTKQFLIDTAITLDEQERQIKNKENEITELHARMAELEKQSTEQADDKKLGERTENSYLTTIGLLLDLLKTPKGFDRDNKPNKPLFDSNAQIIQAITDFGIHGQGKSTLENRFGKANTALDQAKKK